jgi:hypothetical protein
MAIMLLDQALGPGCRNARRLDPVGKDVAGRTGNIGMLCEQARQRFDRKARRHEIVVEKGNDIAVPGKNSQPALPAGKPRGNHHLASFARRGGQVAIGRDRQDDP